METSELQTRYEALTRMTNILVEQLNQIFAERDEIRNQYKSMTGKEMLIN